jgi:tripartite-type tricarboxylate transporter receptor subunit TctC
VNAIAAAVPHLVTVHPSLPVNSLRELVSYLKGQPGKLTFPSAGNGSMPHPGGQHLVAFDTMPASSPHVRSGKLRALAVSSAGRVASFPEVPTAEEAGLPGDQVTTWYGLFAPAGTPPAIVRRLHAAAVSALVRSDTERYARIVKDIGLRID